MILLITYLEEWHYDMRGKRTIKRPSPLRLVSHGVDMETGQNVCLPQEELHSFKPVLIKGENYLL